MNFRGFINDDRVFISNIKEVTKQHQRVHETIVCSKHKEAVKTFEFEVIFCGRNT